MDAEHHQNPRWGRDWGYKRNKTQRRTKTSSEAGQTREKYRPELFARSELDIDKGRQTKANLRKRRREKKEKKKRCLPAMQALVEVDGILAGNDLVLAVLALVHHRDLLRRSFAAQSQSARRNRARGLDHCQPPHYVEEEDDVTAVQCKRISPSYPSIFIGHIHRLHRRNTAGRPA